MSTKFNLLKNILQIIEDKQPSSLEEAGVFRIKNKDGDFKRFKRDDSPEAQLWKMASPKADAKAAKLVKKEEDRLAAEKKLRVIHQHVVSLVSNSFPDADPYVEIFEWLNKNGYDEKDLDKAFKAKENMTFDSYLAGIWQDYAGQAVHDAKLDLENGKDVDENSEFFSIEDGKIKPEKNPWK